MLQSIGYQRIGHDLVTEHQHIHKFVAEVSFVLIFKNFALTHSVAMNILCYASKRTNARMFLVRVWCADSEG